MIGTRQLLLGLTAAALLSGCKGDACKDLAPQMQVNLPDLHIRVAKVQVEISINGAAPLRRTVGRGDLPFVFELGYPGGQRVSIHVLALDESGKVIATGSLDRQTTADGCNRLDISLVPGTVDGGGDVRPDRALDGRRDVPADVARDVAADKALRPDSPADTRAPDVRRPDTALSPDTKLWPDTALSPDTKLLPDTTPWPDARPPDAAPPDTSLSPDSKPPSPCATAVTAVQSFGKGMVGCAGSVSFGNNASLCSSTYTVCTALEWLDRNAGSAPSYNYWVYDHLDFGVDANGNCWALNQSAGGTPCTPASSSMRVCTSSGSDSSGNQCALTGCSWKTATGPGGSFGGCATVDTVMTDSQTAGTLCCLKACALPSSQPAQRSFANGMWGCPALVAFSGRSSACNAGYHVCSVSEYRANRNGVAPDFDYWTNDSLCYNDAAACYASLSAGSCPEGPARVCGTSSTCIIKDCGWAASSIDEDFGAYMTTTDSAGVLCCLD